MKVRIFNEGQSSYMTTVTDVETHEELQGITDVDLHISVRDPYPYALLTVATPVVDVIVDAEIRRVCPCCGRDWTPPTLAQEKPLDERQLDDFMAELNEGAT